MQWPFVRLYTLLQWFLPDLQFLSAQPRLFLHGVSPLVHCTVTSMPSQAKEIAAQPEPSENQKFVIVLAHVRSSERVCVVHWEQREASRSEEEGEAPPPPGGRANSGLLPPLNLGKPKSGHVPPPRNVPEISQDADKPEYKGSALLLHSTFSRF